MTKNKEKVVNLKTNKKKFKKGRFVLSLVIIYLLVFFAYQIFQIMSLKKQEMVQSQRLEEVTRIKTEHEQKYEQVSSPMYIEKIARENLRMIKPGETLYVDNNKKVNQELDEDSEEE